MRHTILSYLVAMAVIAYVQRAAISVPLAEIGVDLSLAAAPWALGLLLSAWQFGYAVCQLPAGGVADRLGAGRTLVLAAVCWSVATALTALAPKYWLMVAAWTAMGVFQAAAFPAAVRTIGRSYGDSERARASGWLGAGMLAGGAVAPVLTAWLLERFEPWAEVTGLARWRLVLAAYAVPGLAWAAAYWWFTRLTAAVEAVAFPRPAAVAAGPTWRQAVADRPLQLLCGQQFLRAAAMVFFITWFPTFLRETRGVSLLESGLLTTCAGAGALVGAVLGGYASDWVLARTGSKRLARQGLAVVGMGTCAALMAVSDVNAAIALITVGAFVATFGGVAGYTVAIDYGGERVGTVFGAMNTAGNLGAMLFPVTIGWLVTATGTWNAVLAAFVVLMAVDAVLWAMLDPRGSFPQAVSRRPGVAAVMLAGFIGLAVASPAEAQAPSGPVTPAERAAIRERVAVLERRLAERETAGLDPDLAADARLYLEAVQRVVDYEPVLDAGGRGQLEAALQAGEARIAGLEAGRQPWTTSAGRSIRGFRSGIDGSTQPFVAIVPPDRNPTVPTRLDVNLHGSLARRSAIGVLDFILGGGGGGGPDFIEIQPLGRLGENAFRFEGETDVFEAIEAACRRFPVDRRRLVLRGTSLGGVAAWQIGLKRPDRFAAVGPAAGPVDTRLFSAAPWPHFIPLEPLTPWQEKTLHLVDAIDYAANAGMVPVVAAMGQHDPYFPSHGQIEKAIAAEGAPAFPPARRGSGSSPGR